MSLIKKRILFVSIFLAILGIIIYFISFDIRVTALVYHSINENYPVSKLALYVKPEVFENQISTLKNNGFSFITYKDIEDWKLKGIRPPKKSVIITFDDGYEDNFTNTLPILQKYNAKATIFIATNLINKPGYLTWDQLKAMKDSGLFEIESHTNRHKILPNLVESAIDDELISSKNAIYENLGIVADVIAYPEGKWSKLTVARAENAGYKVQATSDSLSIGVDTKLENCGRIMVDGAMSGDTVLKRINRSRITSIFKMILNYFTFK